MFNLHKSCENVCQNKDRRISMLNTLNSNNAIVSSKIQGFSLKIYQKTSSIADVSKKCNLDFKKKICDITFVGECFQILSVVFLYHLYDFLWLSFVYFVFSDGMSMTLFTFFVYMFMYYVLRLMQSHSGYLMNSKIQFFPHCHNINNCYSPKPSFKCFFTFKLESYLLALHFSL